MQDFYLWWSIFSTVVALGLLGWDIWQLSASKKEKELGEKDREIHKAQVKLWQHHASGLLHGIIALAQEKFTSIDDVQKAAKVSQASAYSLYTSLNEERLFTEEEIKTKQLKTEEEFQKARRVAETGKLGPDES